MFADAPLSPVSPIQNPHRREHASTAFHYAAGVRPLRATVVELPGSGPLPPAELPADHKMPGAASAHKRREVPPMREKSGGHGFPKDHKDPLAFI